MDFPTFSDFVRIARDKILSFNGRITRETIERQGSDANILVAAMAACADEVTGQLQRVAASLFLDSARGIDLDRLVADRYGIFRKPASQALGTVEFTTTAPAAGSFNIPKGTKLATADGHEHITWVDAVFTAGSTGPVAVEIRSVFSGSREQARKNTITSLVSPITGSPTDLRVTNSLATVGADDEELDDSLRDRARRVLPAARRGVLSAIEAGALATPGVRTARAIENTDVYGRAARSVQLIVTDAFTESFIDSNPTSYQTQSQTLASEVALVLDEYRAAGIFVQIDVASVVLQAVTLALRFRAGVNVDLVALMARGAVVAKINSLRPGQSIVPSELVDAMRPISGLEITGQEILSPPGTVTAQPLQVLRTSMGLVVASTTQPDRALQGSANPDGV